MSGVDRSLTLIVVGCLEQCLEQRDGIRIVPDFICLLFFRAYKTLEYVDGI